MINLKTKLCNYLIENNKVKEFDVIRHSYSTSRMKEWQKRNVETNNIAPTLDTRCDCLGVVVKGEDMNENKPKVIGGIGEKKSNGGSQWYQQDRIYDNNVGLSLSTTAQPYYPDNNLRIRKLTPKECWRLMGFDDSDFEKASKVNSNSQLYKQAGNSIVVNVLEAILKNLLSENEQKQERQITIDDFI
jgi:site-specific DNA-cytosine methylase